MEGAAIQLDRFLRAVHRRLVIVRAVERGGACAAVAAGFAGVLAGAMLWSGQDGLVPAVATLALGAAIGLVWGLVRGPRMIDAAVEADRQLQLADLLATALAVRGSEDPFAHAVVAVAEQRCRALSPDAIMLHRLGSRAWGGIGLAAALVVTLGALSALPADSRARQDAVPELQMASPRADAQRSDDAITVATSTSKHAIAPSDSDSKGSTDTAQSSVTDPGDVIHLAPGHDPGLSRASLGTAAGRTKGALQPPDPAAVAVGREHPTDAGRDNGSAGGRAGEAGGSVSAVTTGVRSAGSRHSESPSPPWQSPSSASDRQGALRAVDAGNVPDRCRDVVREYFRDDAKPE
jgi:hypothetical protein